MDSKRRYWETHVYVQKIQNILEFIYDVSNTTQSHTYVLVYPLYVHNPFGPKHCIYAESYDHITGEIVCINSDQNNPTPRIPIKSPGLILYKVSCKATEMKQLSTSSHSQRKCGLCQNLVSALKLFGAVIAGMALIVTARELVY